VLPKGGRKVEGVFLLGVLEWKTADSIQVSNFVLARHRLSSHQVRLG
jgi:hypothetical protein